ncbi:uncharacterized protein LOC100880554 isoform X2 [Megachile rotundata]|uniref:uncharacterized protein LOC100880554 isoform X2 n=1 Tax=Megachile rotundata TaxID=143995 RepID=UPI003FD5E3AD
MLMFRITSASRQSTNSFLGSLHMNQICKSYLKVFNKAQTVFYSNLREKSIFVTSNKFKEINNHDNNRINQHGQHSMRKIQDTENGKSNSVSTLDAIYQAVDNELNQKCLSISFSTLQNEQGKNMVKCSIDIKWPQDMSFSYEADNKKTAKQIAARMCLQWLDKNRKIKKQKPVLYSYKDIQRISEEQKSVEINLESEFKNEIQTLIHTFKQAIQPIIKEQPMIDSEANNSDEKQFKYEANTSFYQERNSRLAKQLKNRENKICNLPISNYRQEILDILKSDQVLLIKGNTGCGKSTQVAQFIMDEYTKENRACECNIIVTQPRRVAAISLAYRVASERNEKMGDVIGYHIRFDNIKPKLHGSIIFSTSGILLRMLESNPTLEGISHVIIDEAHERSVHNDILLKLMKEILQKNQSIKLLIMSATINESLFQQYFSCKVIDIPGKLYPVKMHFKEDIQIFQSKLKKHGLMELRIPFGEIVQLVQWIVKNKPPGCILCFLPGWQEIKRLHNLLKNAGIANLLILPLHSKVSHENQLEVFDPAPKNMTKVILATDIAECSVTIEDVCYVIDTAIKREYQWYENDTEPVLTFSLVSKANIDQRKGRAGRTRPGESYHLITKKEYDTLDLDPKPEIFTEPLEATIITIKKLSNEKVNDFFSNMLQSPSSKSICNALKNLKALGFLDDDENLTDLGKRASHFSLDPKLSKAIVLSYVFQCVKPILSLVSIPFGESSTVSLDEKLSEKSSIKSQKLKFHKTSDHIAMLQYYNHWSSPDNKFENIFAPSYFHTAKQLQKLHASELISSGLFTSSFDSNSINMFCNNYELIRAILFAATNHLIKRNAYGYKGYYTKYANTLRSEDSTVVEVNNDSVNHNRKMWPSEVMTYLRKRRVSRLYTISETSMLTPLSVLLFSHNDIQCFKDTENCPNEQEKIYIKLNNIDNVEFCCDEETAKLLLQFRTIIWNLVDYIIKYQGVNTNEDDLKAVKSYKTKVMTVLANMLEKSSTNIDSSTEC